MFPQASMAWSLLKGQINFTFTHLLIDKSVYNAKKK
jgi:hypothetical protein